MPRDKLLYVTFAITISITIAIQILILCPRIPILCVSGKKNESEKWKKEITVLDKEFPKIHEDTSYLAQLYHYE